MMDRLISLFQRIVTTTLLGDEWWARLRLLLPLGMFLLLAADSIMQQDTTTLLILIFLLWICIWVFAIGASYIQDLYKIASFSLAARYLFSSLFGFFYPVQAIEHGHKVEGSDRHDLLKTIGGPGYLQIYPGNAVLLEKLAVPSQICGGGRYFVHRFEQIKEIVDLDEQQYESAVVGATSKDGIPVTVKNVFYHYRILSGANHERTVKNPYPYSVKAIKDFVYNRSVTNKGLTSWEKAVGLAVESVITDFINENPVDQITAPAQLEKDPRQEIIKKLKSPALRNRLKSFGTELTWFDIGSINAGNDKVDVQRLRAWQAKWNGEATVVRAHGEAQRIAYKEIGRVETQSELLRGILNSFRGMQPSDKHKDNIRKIIMARTAQILEAMTSIRDETNGDAAKRAMDETTDDMNSPTA